MADQLRSYYNTQRIHCKTWKPLFSFLFDTTVGNCYKLSSYKPSNGARGTQKDTHLQFRKDLRDTLLRASQAPNRARGKKTTRKGIEEIIWKPVKEHKVVKLWKKPLNCSACVEASRKVTNKNFTARKPLANLSINATRKSPYSKDWKRPQRALRTQYSYSIYRIPFYTVSGSRDSAYTGWDDHLAKLNSKD